MGQGVRARRAGRDRRKSFDTNDLEQNKNNYRLGLDLADT